MEVPRHYGYDGKPFDRPGHIVPILLILPEDVGVKSLPEYKAGWYWSDEAELITGPYETMEEAIEMAKAYALEFLG